MKKQEADEAISKATGRWLTDAQASAYLKSSKVKIISHTQLALFQKCPLAWKYRYIDGIKQPPPSAALHVGRRAHEVLADNNVHKIKTGKDLGIKPFIGRLEDRWKTGIDDVDWKREKETPGQAKDSAIRILNKYHVQRARFIKPVACERTFVIEVPFIAKRPLLGVVDLEEEATEMSDYKTTDSSPNAQIRDQIHIDKSSQLSMYAMAKLVIDGVIPKSVRLEYLVRTKEPKAIPISGKKTMDDIRRIAYLIYHITRAMETGDIWPNTESFLHSPRNCGYWDHCHKNTRMELIGL